MVRKMTQNGTRGGKRKGARNWVKIFSCFFTCYLIFALFSAVPAGAAGATFSINPGSGEFRVGDTVTASIMVHSGGNSINAAEATINFPTDLLRVVSISKANSIFGLWPEEPSFNNSQGVISFVGGTTTPTIVSSGRVISIKFTIKSAGNATVNFSGSRILLADGKGTNIFSGAQGAAWKLTSRPVPAKTPVPAVPPIAGTPSAPKVTSSTHPDSDKWYNNDNPRFNWTLPPEITGVNILGDKNPNTDPGTQSDGLFDSYEYFDVDDGVWFFHIRLHNSVGWGDVGHFRFQIDTKPPEPFTIKFAKEVINESSHPKISFSTEDKLSGIDRYEVRIDDGPWLKATNLKESDFYVLPKQRVGEHRITVRAFDKASNSTDATAVFMVVSAPPKFLGYISRFWLPILFSIALVLIAYLLYRLLDLKQGIKKGVLEAERGLHRAFDILRDNVKSQIQLLERVRSKRELTSEEDKVLTHLKDHLDEAEKLIKKKIGGIGD